MIATAFLDQLDAASPEEREALFATTTSAFTADDVAPLLHEERASAGWLLLRVLAGPPGRPLPDRVEALERVMTDQGDVLDAWSVVMRTPPLVGELPLVPVVVNAAVSAWRAGGTYLSLWMSLRAALAALVAGEPERTWTWLAIDRPGKPAPALELLRVLGGLRADPSLVASHWTRCAAWGLYVTHAFPAIPRLEWPDSAPERPRADYVDAVGRLNDAPLREAIMDGLMSWHRHVVSDLDGHAGVRAIHDAVLRQEEAPPDVPAPENLELWMWEAHIRAQYEAARLAALLLLRTAHQPEAGPVLMVMMDARPVDAPLLAERAPAALRGVWQELLTLVPLLSTTLWRDLALALTPSRRDFAQAAARVHSEMAVVRAAAAECAEILARLDVIDATEARIADTAGGLPALLAIVADVRARLPPLDRLEPAGLAAAVEASATVAEPTNLAMHLRLTDPLDRLLAGLVLRRSIAAVTPPIPEAAAHLAEHAWVCASALWDLYSLRLFPLRESLLAEAAAGAPTPADRVRASLALANTRNALSSGDEGRIAETARSLVRAVDACWSLGEPQLLVDAIFLWIRTLTLGPLADEERGAELLASARAALSRARALGFTDGLRGKLAWAEATLHRHGGPDESTVDHAAALPLLDEAARLLQPGDPGWIDVQRERGHSLVLTGQVEEGIAALRRLVDEVAPTLPPLEQGYLLGALGDALVIAGNTEEAASILQEALRLVADDGPGAHIALQYAQVLSGIGDVDKASDLAERVHKRAGTLSRVDRLDLHLLRMSLAVRRHQPDVLAEATRAALGLSVGTAWEPLVLLRRAVLAEDRTEALAVVHRYLASAWPRSNAVDKLVSQVFERDPEGLSESQRERAITWAREAGRPWTAARLLDAAGRAPEARALLEDHLRTLTSRRDRTAARLLLLAVIPREDTAALRATIEAIEGETADLSTLGGPALCDLGAACSIASAGDPAWIRRGRTHVEMSLRDASGRFWEAHAAFTFVRLTAELLQAALPRSTAELAMTARPAVTYAGRVGAGGLHGVQELAGLLLLGGPLVQSDCLDVAEDLLAVVPGPGTPEAVVHEALCARARSIREVLAGERARVQPLPEELNATVPFDDGPTWIVRLVQEDGIVIDPADALRELNPVAVACAVRPDRSDALLSYLLGLAPRLKPAALEEVLALVHVVAATGRQGSAGWPLTRSALDSLARKGDGVVLRILEAMDGYSAPKGSGSAAPAPARPLSGEERLDEGIRAMTAARAASTPEEAASWKVRAIEHLRAAVEALAGTPEEGEAHVSLGNAIRLKPGRDCGAAIREYELAAKVLPSDPDAQSRLHKVWADALVQRGGADDICAAWEHIQRSLRLRRDGGFRTASLFTAANIAFRHPDWSPTQRTRQVARTLGEAASLNPADVEAFLPRILVALAAWAKTGVDPAERAGLVAQLLRLFPESRDDIERAAQGHTAFMHHDREDPETRVEFLIGDPNFGVVVETISLLHSPVQRASNEVDFRTDSVIPPQLRAEFARTSRERPTLYRDVDGMQQHLEKLREGSLETEPGRAVARVALLAALCRQGVGAAKEVRAETARATAAVEALNAPVLQSALLDCLATVWSPRDVHGDPVADYRLAADLCRTAVAVSGGEEQAHRDVLGTLGRALRYRMDGDRQENLREALRLYRRVLALDRKAGWAPGIANDLDLIADVETHAGDGDERARLLRAAETSREAVRIAVDDHSKALYSANLAWTLTKLGDRLDPEDAVRALLEADDLYQNAIAGPLDENERSNAMRNRTVCHELLALRRGDGNTGPELWRAEIARFVREARPLDAATAEHNLAEALVRRGTEPDLREAVALYRGALRLRTRAVNARFHWESNIGLGRALLHLVDAVEEPEQGWFSEAERAFILAAETARILGCGQELHWAGKELLLLAQNIDRPTELVRVGEAAWSAIAEASPALLLHREHAVAAAFLARQTAFWMAHLLSDDGVTARIPRGFVLRKRSADRVLRWLLRSDRALVDQVHSRLRPPVGVAAGDWLAWQRELASGDDGVVVKRVASFRAVDPAWLAREPALDHTMAWLKRVPGSVAVGVWPGSTGALCVLIDGNSGECFVLGLHGPPLPEEADLARALRPEDRWKLLEGLTSLCRQVITERIVDWMGKAPRRILWCPHGALRLVPPGALFPGAEIAVAASLALGAPAAHRSRSEEVAVVLADPGVGVGALGPEALPTVQRLLQVAGPKGRGVVSVGARSGPTVLAGAVASPASAAQVLREIDHVGTLVLIAHGRSEGPEDAWIECIGADGGTERLDVAMLQRDPSAVSGLSVILLSCETGRTGDLPGHVGGVAGALLAAGAREVVAPLYPVALGGAERIAEAALLARARNADLSSALAEVSADARRGPELGGRARPPEEQRAGSRWDVLGFVTWVG